jgi:hypothetical protein
MLANKIWDTPSVCICDHSVCSCDKQEQVVRNVAAGIVKFDHNQRTMLIMELTSGLFVDHAPLRIQLVNMSDADLANTALLVWWSYYRSLSPQ